MPQVPTVEAQIETLEKVMAMLRSSHRGRDGFIAEPEVVLELECLAATRAMLTRN